jgi:MFS family permease
MGLLPDGGSSKDLKERDDQEVRDNEAVSPSGLECPLSEREARSPSRKPSPIRKELNLRETFKTVRFWYAIFYPSCTTFGVYIIIVHHVRYLVDLGVEKVWAASLFAAIGALSAGFRFFWGWFSDRVGREITFTLGGACFSSGILFLILFQDIPSVILLYLFALFFGAGWGVTAPMFMSITGDLYKGKHFGLIYGMVEGTVGLGSAVGAWMAGYIFDQTQNYFWAFVLAIFFNLISILLVWFAAPRKFRRPHPYL